jgi:hypothetical protein
MIFSWTICHPQDSEIEYGGNTLNTQEVIDKFTQYSWENELIKFGKLKDPQYSPSMGFKNITNQFGFELSAIEENGQLLFSAWFERLIKKKSFFGLGKEKEVMDLKEKWSFGKQDSIRLLSLFVNGKYDELELELD